jgi:hypothetical protein
MLPHIIFHSETEKTYFPNYDFWDSNVNPGAPLKPKSSGITQPAVHGFVLENLLEKFPDNEKLLDFAKAIFPKIVNNHRFFYNYRDPEREGLTYIFHPWESGRDNSPLWDESLDRIILNNDQIPEYQRRDINIASSGERPTSYQYDRYVYLLNLGKNTNMKSVLSLKKVPFLIQDTLMNAVLIRSNQSLIRIGKRFGFDIDEIKEWQEQAKPQFAEKLWNESLETYVVYDLRGKKQVLHKEIGGLTALLAEIPDEQKAKNAALHHSSQLLNSDNKLQFVCS